MRRRNGGGNERKGEKGKEEVRNLDELLIVADIARQIPHRTLHGKDEATVSNFQHSLIRIRDLRGGGEGGGEGEGERKEGGGEGEGEGEGRRE